SKSASGDHPRDRTDHCHCGCRDGGRGKRVPQRSRVRGVAGFGATATLDRWQSPPWRHLKRGNRYLRRLLINGASANLLRSKATNADPWVIGLRRRRPSLVVAVAPANKTARSAWAVMHRQENYQRMAAAA